MPSTPGSKPTFLPPDHPWSYRTVTEDDPELGRIAIYDCTGCGTAFFGLPRHMAYVSLQDGSVHEIFLHSLSELRSDLKSTPASIQQELIDGKTN